MGPGSQGCRQAGRQRLGHGRFRILSPEALARKLRLVVITDEELASRSGLDAVVDSALSAGAPTIQVRSKEAGAAELLALADRLAARIRAAGALLIINDRLDVALAVGADGVHLGPDDLPVSAARQAAPDGFLIGYSTAEPADARRAVAEGASYLGCGAVYGTVNKVDAGDAIGPDGLRRVVAAVDVPVVGIGGITPARVEEVASTGAAGCAVIGAIMESWDPGGTARELLAAFEEPR